MAECPHVLVIEDDPSIRESLESLLDLYGYSVATVADGAAALSWLRSGRPLPALILLDLMMPGMNGLEFRSQQRSDQALAGIPIVVITGAGTLVDEKAGELNADVLRKPFELETLLATVRRFCGP